MPANDVLVVEDDRFLRVVGVVLDPQTPAERYAAFADFFAHDEPDFDDYCQRVRARRRRLFPAQVRLVETTGRACAAALPGSSRPDRRIAAGRRARACRRPRPARRAEVRLQAAQHRHRRLRRARRQGADHPAPRQHRLRRARHRADAHARQEAASPDGRISAEQLAAVGYHYKPFDRRHTPNSNWARIAGLRMLNGATIGIIGARRDRPRDRDPGGGIRHAHSLSPAHPAVRSGGARAARQPMCRSTGCSPRATGWCRNCRGAGDRGLHRPRASLRR